MLEASDKTILEDIADECIKLDIKCGSGMNQQNSGEHSYVNQIYSETMCQNVSTLRNINKMLSL